MTGRLKRASKFAQFGIYGGANLINSGAILTITVVS
jgi:hypothetical protein